MGLRIFPDDFLRGVSCAVFPARCFLRGVSCAVFATRCLLRGEVPRRCRTESGARFHHGVQGIVLRAIGTGHCLSSVLRVADARIAGHRDCVFRRSPCEIASAVCWQRDPSKPGGVFPVPKRREPGSRSYCALGVRVAIDDSRTTWPGNYSVVVIERAISESHQSTLQRKIGPPQAD